MSSVAAAKKPLTVTEPASEKQRQEEAIASPKPSNELMVSDVLAGALGEPLKTIWLFAKGQQGWITVRDVQRKNFAILKGKSSEQIHRYVGLLSDTGYGKIDEEGKSHSSVAFLAH
jgi:hypothetical protein